MLVYTLWGAAIGLVASLCFVWFFVDSDMVFIFFIAGMVLGAACGLTAATVTRRHHHDQAA